MTNESAVTFRLCARDDISTFGRWLADPEVAQWWPEDDLGEAALLAKYGPIIDGDEPTFGYVVSIEGSPAGFIQAYRIADHPDYARQLALETDAVGIDVYIGAAEFRGRGWSGPLLTAFLRQVVFGEMAAEVAVLAPSPANARAIRAYERVGFRWLKTVPVVDEEDPLGTGDEYVMTLARESFDHDDTAVDQGVE